MCLHKRVRRDQILLGANCVNRLGELGFITIASGKRLWEDVREQAVKETSIVRD